MMRLQFTLVVCALTVATLPGCSSSSGSRTGYRTSSSGSRPSVNANNQYDADPPSAPSLANSPFPARQTSSRETPVQGISFGTQPLAATQTGQANIQQVGYRRSIFGKLYRACDPCCEEQVPGCSAPRGAYCAPKDPGCFAPRQKYCCPDRQACVPQHHCVQKYCGPPCARPAHQPACGSEGCHLKPHAAPRQRRSLLAFLFCHDDQSCGSACAESGCCAPSTAQVSQRPSEVEHVNHVPAYTDQSQSDVRTQPQQTAPHKSPSAQSIPNVPAVPQFSDPMNGEPGRPMNVEDVPEPPTSGQSIEPMLQPIQPMPMPQAFNGVNDGWQEPSSWPRLGIPAYGVAPTTRVATGQPTWGNTFHQPNIQPAGWGR